MTTNLITLRVSNTTNVQKLATSVVKTIQEGKKVEIACIGVQPNLTALKAIAIANAQFAPEGKLLLSLPTYRMVSFEGYKTATPEPGEVPRPIDITALVLVIFCLPIHGLSGAA